MPLCVGRVLDRYVHAYTLGSYKLPLKKIPIPVTTSLGYKLEGGSVTVRTYTICLKSQLEQIWPSGVNAEWALRMLYVHV